MPAAQRREITLDQPHGIGVDAAVLQFVHEAVDPRHVVDQRIRAGDDGDVAVAVLEQGARRHPPALRMVDREALLRDVGEIVVQRDDQAPLGAQGRDVFVEQGAGHHDQAVAAALDQEFDALDRLVAGVAQADAEGDHHVQAGGAQFGVDNLKDRGVEGAGQHRDVDANHPAGTGQQGARRVRGPEAQLVDRLAHAFERGRRYRALAAHYARGGAETYSRQPRYVLDCRHRDSYPINALIKPTAKHTASACGWHPPFIAAPRFQDRTAKHGRCRWRSAPPGRSRAAARHARCTTAPGRRSRATPPGGYPSARPG